MAVRIGGTWIGGNPRVPLEAGVVFVPKYTLVGEASAPKLGLLLHGALGSGNNLRSLATKLCKLRPEYRFCLVDLRHHGESQGAPPPNTLEACARDLSALIEQLGQEPEVLAGHSFGGKTALMFAQLFPGRARQIWVLDSNPGSQEPTAANEVIRVIQAVRSTTTPAADRALVIAELGAQGLSPGTSNWLATNLVRQADRQPDGFVWRFNLDAIYELMLDYFRVDLWPVLESRATETDFRVVVAENSDRWAPENRARLQALVETVPQAQISVRSGGTVALHIVPNAGHWLHVDNPAFLLELMGQNLY
ncbi:MAG TPA: alpha/beta hydrolase [Polyangiaceae bacterium]|nr:alpha/beta hydrolase [Polyangiaceae bacterium]